MNFSKCLVAAAFVGVAFVGPACADKAVDETQRDAGTARDATRARADKALDATKKAGGAIADATKDVALATGAAMSDGWITTKVKAKFADETALEGSHINVDTSDHVVTLRGTVGSGAAKARAAEIARGTEGVTRVVNQLAVT